MYTKAEYFKDISKYDFKKYNVEVVPYGLTYQDLSIKIMLNNKVAYEIKPGTFSYKTIQDGKVVRTKFFIKYEPFKKKVVVWRDCKNIKKFNSWCGNYRVQNEIKSKLEIVLDKFARDLQ